ncbi:hypothetical protein D3C71_1595680 [compost metagenome]
MVEDLTSDRPDRWTGTAVFQNDGDRNRRIIEGSEGRHQFVVTQVLCEFVGVIGFVTEYLRGPRFRRGFVWRTCKVLACRPIWAVGHAIHAVFGNFPEAGMNIADLRALFLLERHQHAIDTGALQQVRRFDVAVVNQGGQRLGHLDRRRRPITLADTYRNGVPLIPGFFIAFEFPVTSRHQAGTLF